MLIVLIGRMKSSLIILVLVLTGCLHRSSSNDAAFSYQAQPVLFIPATIPIPTTSFSAARPTATLRHRFHDLYDACCPCVMFMLGTSDYLKNKWLLPLEPLPILESSYLSASSIEAGILGPFVRVEDYPPGKFGNFIRDDYLMMEKGESSDEGDMRVVFSALANALDTNDEYIYYGVIDGTRESLEKYAKRPVFMPEIYFSFRGRNPLSIEIDKRENEDIAIIRKADSIGIYTVRPSSIPLLEALCHIISRSTQAN